MGSLLTSKLQTALFGVMALACTSLKTEPHPHYAEELTSQLSSKPKAHIFPTVRTFEAAPLEEGQWVKYLMTDRFGRRTLRTLLVAEKSTNHESWWIEQEVLTDFRKTLTRAEVTLPDASSRDALPKAGALMSDTLVVNKVLEWQVNPNKVLEAPLDAGKDFVKLLSLSDTPVFDGQRSTTVRAGFFHSCFRMESKANGPFASGHLSACLDPRIPLGGLVELRDTEGTTWELVDFGITGVASLVSRSLLAENFE